MPAFSLPTLIEEIAAVVSARAVEKGVSLRAFTADDVPASLGGEPEHLRRVLSRLLDNAVRFTAAGEVRLDVRLASGPEEAVEPGIVLRFTVIDPGIGVERDARDGAFEGGGLARVRQIVRLMGGDLHLHSIPGEGSTFWFTARFEPVAAAETPPPPLQAPPTRPLRILIAEDNAVNQLVLAEQLSTLGHAPRTVSNGRDALAALANAEWDAILLDCQMPVMDGYQTVAAIRRREAAGARRVWVVAVTANALDGEREACLRAGMDDFLSKPFHFRDLAWIIARIPQASSGPRQPVDAARLESLVKAKAAGGENLLERMAALFIESGRQILDEMDQALRAKDFPAAVRAAHKLAGGCSYFGAEDLFSVCTEAQRLGRAGDFEGVRAAVPRIREEYERVELALLSDRAAA